MKDLRVKFRLSVIGRVTLWIAQVLLAFGYLLSYVGIQSDSLEKLIDDLLNSMATPESWHIRIQ